MNRKRMIVRAGAKSAALVSVALVGLTGTAGAQSGSTSYQATLNSLNGSGDSGTAMVEVNGQQVTVKVTVAGASAALPHAQHIHIGGTNSCPTAGVDPDGDGITNTAEGQPSYGPIMVSLTTSGDVSPDSGLAVDRMPGADGGRTTYTRTFALPAGVSPADIAKGVIVTHGFAESKLGTDPAKYDGKDSELKAGVPAEATAPVTCARLVAAPAGGVGTGGGAMAATKGPDTTVVTGAAIAVAGFGLAASVAMRRRKNISA